MFPDHQLDVTATAVAPVGSKVDADGSGPTP